MLFGTMDGDFGTLGGSIGTLDGGRFEHGRRGTKCGGGLTPAPSVERADNAADRALVTAECA